MVGGQVSHLAAKTPHSRTIANFPPATKGHHKNIFVAIVPAAGRGGFKFGWKYNLAC